MKKYAIIAALFLSLLPLSAEPVKPDFIVSPFNVELGMRSLVYSPMVDPSFGINMEFGFNPGWFINRQLCVGAYFAYAHYFGAGYASAFLSDATAGYTPVDYIYTGPETTTDQMLEGMLDDLSDHRWGLTLRLPIRYSPFLKAYWLSRAVVVKSGSSGSTTVGGITWVGGGSSGFSFVGQGAGAELVIPLGVIDQRRWNWFAFSRVSFFAQYVDLKNACFDGPRPLFSEMFNSGFNGKYGDLWEFGFSISIGF